MGAGITSGEFTRDDRTRYRRKIRRCLDVFAMMLDDFQFDADHTMTGLELEINLVDESVEPAMRNAEVLADLRDSSFQAELGLFNIEFNGRPRMISGRGFEDYETDILTRLNHLDDHAHKSDASIVLVGILPTMTERHTVLQNLSPVPRYLQLNSEIMEARGADMSIDIRGVDHLQTEVASIAPEAACTSVQFHLQVSPESFASYWNAAQAIAGVQLAVGANSPFVYGRELWAETRIPLFEQATDTRPEEMKNQGVRQRVWFGERWITSIFDLFEENLRYFPPLLPICDTEDPVEVVAAGGVPRLAELRLQNGTVYRWNRPVYDIMNARPHLRVENRVLPAGPTVVDIMANAAFYFGLVRELADADRPIWTSLAFSQAESNFFIGARDGIASQFFWPRFGEIDATTLILDHLLPKAYSGLDRFGVSPDIRDRLLGIIEGRCRTRRNGATWQVETVRRLEATGTGRSSALREMLRRYADHLSGNVPVHLWDLD
ncbi:MAG TPA: glutamate-cysteine ligase family protein [Micromonosporaceae bacterium]